MVLYFAYGSNLLPARLQARCPSARILEPAITKGRRLEFSKPGADNSSKATLALAAGSEESATPGVVFEIDSAELQQLDRAEGVGYGYKRDDTFEVIGASTGRAMSTICYLATKTHLNHPPYDWYLALVVAGYRHHRFDDTFITRLLNVPYKIDDATERPGRIAALHALKQHGYGTAASLLDQAGPSSRGPLPQ